MFSSITGTVFGTSMLKLTSVGFHSANIMQGGVIGPGPNFYLVLLI